MGKNITLVRKKFEERHSLFVIYIFNIFVEYDGSIYAYTCLSL